MRAFHSGGAFAFAIDDGITCETRVKVPLLCMAERHIVDVVTVRLWHAPAFTSGEYQQDGDDGVNAAPVITLTIAVMSFVILKVRKARFKSKARLSSLNIGLLMCN